MGPELSDYAGTVITTDNKRTWWKPKPLSDAQCGNLSLILVIPLFLGIVCVLFSAYPILLVVPIIIIIAKYYRIIHFWIRTVL